MAGPLAIGLSAWIIQDTNYPDFAQGSRTEFALEFWAGTPLEEIEPHVTMLPSQTHRGSATHTVIARVVRVADDWWVIDVDVLVFQNYRPPANARPGAWLCGDVYIGIDPFFYFEDFGHRTNAPALIYDWAVKKVEIQTAPLIEISPRTFARDPAKLGWKEIAETRAWEDNGEYLLHCAFLGGPRWPRSRCQP